MQFGSIDPLKIPKKLRWFIVCMQCECECKSKHEENIEMMSIELPHRNPQMQSVQTTTTSSTKTEDNVNKDSKTEQSTVQIVSSVNSSSTAPVLSTNAIRECKNKSVV